MLLSGKGSRCEFDLAGRSAKPRGADPVGDPRPGSGAAGERAWRRRMRAATHVRGKRTRTSSGMKLRPVPRSGTVVMIIHHPAPVLISVVEPFQVPRPLDAVEVDQGQPALADHLHVVAGDRLAPPGLLDPPAVADLHRLAAAVPDDGDGLARRIGLDRDGRVLAQRGSSADPRLAQCRPNATSSAPRPAAPRDRAARPGGPDPPRTSGRASASCQPSRASRAACGTNNGSC